MQNSILISEVLGHISELSTYSTLKRKALYGRLKTHTSEHMNHSTVALSYVPPMGLEVFHPSASIYGF